MENKPNAKSLKETYKKIRFQLHIVLKHSWPINWKYFQNRETVIKALSQASAAAKSIVIISISGILLSTLLLFYGIYIVSTKDSPDTGGEIREAVVDSSMSIFNPASSFASDAEQRVNALLYHPLYTVVYPGALSDGESKPTIKPVLLSKLPEWTDINPEKPTESYKKLKFSLRKDIKWSNGKPITLNDIQYTFDLIKPTSTNPGGNPQFKETFKQVKLNPLNETEFELVSDTSNPQLIYNSNFSPISKEYFSGLNVERLNSDIRSVKPLVTSGYFTFADSSETDPDNPKNTSVENPIKDSNNNYIKTAILSRNPIQNILIPIYVDKYIFKNYYTLEETGANAPNSLEKASKDGKIDIIVRSLSPSSSISSFDLKSKLKLNQITKSTNTFYSLFLNLKIDQYFINQTLRKYVICEFSKFNLGGNFLNSVDNLQTDRRLIPIQFSKNSPTDCPEDTGAILDPTYYTISQQDGKKSVNFRGEQIELDLAGVEESEPILDEVKKEFETIGFKMAEVIKDNAKLEEAIKTKSYNAIFLPVTYTNSDPYSIFGTSGQNLSAISQNNKIRSYDVEGNLKKYTASTQADLEAKNKLIEFFSKEYVSVNLFRGKSEINYSERIAKSGAQFDKSIPLVITLPTDISIDFAQISFKTKRTKK